jgi:hypothetical protein
MKLHEDTRSCLYVLHVFCVSNYEHGGIAILLCGSYLIYLVLGISTSGYHSELSHSVLGVVNIY